MRVCFSKFVMCKPVLRTTVLHASVLMYKLGYKFKFQLCRTADLFVFFLCYAFSSCLRVLKLLTCLHNIDYYSSVSINLQKFSASLKKND